jgi:hypothetical protein
MATKGYVERDGASFWPVLKVAAAAGRCNSICPTTFIHTSSSHYPKSEEIAIIILYVEQKTRPGLNSCLSSCRRKSQIHHVCRTSYFIPYLSYISYHHYIFQLASFSHRICTQLYTHSNYLQVPVAFYSVEPSAYYALLRLSCLPQ